MSSKDDPPRAADKTVIRAPRPKQKPPSPPERPGPEGIQPAPSPPREATVFDPAGGRNMPTGWSSGTVLFQGPTPGAAANAAPETDVVTRAALLGELAAYYDTQLGDAPRAIAAYTRWLEVDPSNPATVRRSTTALARLYQEGQKWPELRAIMRKQAEWAEDPSERRALLARVAALEEEQLQDRSAAIATWAELLADQPTDAGALNAVRTQEAGKACRIDDPTCEACQ